MSEGTNEEKNYINNVSYYDACAVGADDTVCSRKSGHE